MSTFPGNVQSSEIFAIGDINISFSIDQCTQSLTMTVSSRFVHSERSRSAGISHVYLSFVLHKHSDTIGMTIHSSLMDWTGSFKVPLVYVSVELEKGFNALQMPIACCHVNRSGSRVGGVVDIRPHRRQDADALGMPELSSQPHSTHAVIPRLIHAIPSKSYGTKHLCPCSFRSCTHELRLVEFVRVVRHLLARSHSERLAKTHCVMLNLLVWRLYEQRNFLGVVNMT